MKTRQSVDRNGAFLHRGRARWSKDVATVLELRGGPFNQIAFGSPLHAMVGPHSERSW